MLAYKPNKITKNFLQSGGLYDDILAIILIAGIFKIQLK